LLHYILSLMKILLTGATGYIAQRLLPALLDNGNEVVCCVRDKARFHPEKYKSSSLSVIEADSLKPETLTDIPKDITVAYYLIHSMSTRYGDFEELEKESAMNFKTIIQQTNVLQVIYLSGIVNEEKLSKHLSSRKNVEEILSSGSYALTALRAGIIIGSGSASFEIIRDLVEKLPVMIAPQWLNTATQSIAIRNVIEFLSGVLLNEPTFNRSYDIGGPDILNYKQMLLTFAKVRGLKRRIGVVPVMTPKLSSYWLYFITSTSYTLAQNLHNGISTYANVPVNGCFIDSRKQPVFERDKVFRKILSIGGSNGWYYGDWLWGIRGFIDKLFGGVGQRRGRKNQNDTSPREVLDFLRVLIADKKEKRLLLFAEMKLPGEAWPEFRIDKNNYYNGKFSITQNRNTW
jgi:uncharacterized protein YbjT (DUF2867 family)